MTDPGPMLDGVRITRGRFGDSPTTQPTTIEGALRDDDGDFSPRNPEGQYYGQLRKGTPMQIAVDLGSGPQVLARAAQQAWNPRWDGTNEDGSTINPRVPIDALGILARLSRDTEQRSALKHTILRATGPEPVAYWPLEDGFDADIAGPGIPDAAPMSVVGGEITFAADDTLPGSAATPDMTAGALHGAVPSTGSSTAWFVEFWLKANFSAGSRAAYFFTDGADVATWGIRQPASASGQFDVFVFDSAGGTTASLAGTVTDWTEGEWHHFAITAEQNGANIDTLIYSEGVAVGGGLIPTVTLGRVTDVFANDFDAFDFADLLSIAHIAVGDGTTITDSYLARDAYVGEAASDRVGRVLTEAGIAHVITAGDSTLMGPQPVDTTLNIVRECEVADHGTLFELRDGRPCFQPLRSRWDAPVALALSYTDLQVTDLVPFDDDRDLYNVIIVSRPGGSSATAVQTDGPVGTDETTGIGPRRLPVTINIETDAGLIDHAGWLLMVCTVDQPRYVLALDPYNIEALRQAVIDLDVGSRITIGGVPSRHVGPQDLDLIFEGEQINIGAAQWLHALCLEPYEPYRIYRYVDDANPGTDPARYAHPGSETDEDLDTTETGVTVENTETVDWGTDDLPYDIGIGGEQMTVTAVSGTGATQTLTVTRSVNGVVKEHATGAPVQLWSVARYALPTVHSGSAIYAGKRLDAPLTTGPNAGDVLDELGIFFVEGDILYPPTGMYLDGTGDYATTASTADLQITGDITLEAEITADDYTPGAFDVIGGKYVSAGNQRSYYLGINTSGEIVIGWSTAGTGATELTETSTGFPIPATNATRIAIKAKLDVDDGGGNRVATFEYADSIDGPWTQLDTNTTAGTTSIFASTAALTVGAVDAGATAPFAGIVHRFRVRSGLDGAIVADVRFLDEVPGTTSLVDETGRTWTLAGNAAIG